MLIFTNRERERERESYVDVGYLLQRSICYSRNESESERDGSYREIHSQMLPLLFTILLIIFHAKDSQQNSLKVIYDPTFSKVY